MQKEIGLFSELIEDEVKKLQLPNNPTNLYEPIRYFLSLGGKRIRPVLTFLGHELYEKHTNNTIQAALAIELFHNFSLIHDDIMDEAPLRRNKETVHTRWNSNIAILSGDVLFVKAYECLAKTDEKQLAKLLKLFNKTAVEVCEGQQMDMDFESIKLPAIGDYIEMIRLKTSVLIGCALAFGAITANASNKDVNALYTFGEQIGIAFQIQDDILDLYADPKKFGKQVGGDVMANKKTILFLTAYQLASPLQKEFLLNLQLVPDNDLKVEKTKELFALLNVKDEANKIKERHFENGMKALDKLSISKENCKTLIELAYFLKDREI